MSYSMEPSEAFTTMPPFSWWYTRFLLSDPHSKHPLVDILNVLAPFSLWYTCPWNAQLWSNNLLILPQDPSIENTQPWHSAILYLYLLQDQVDMAAWLDCQQPFSNLSLWDNLLFLLPKSPKLPSALSNLASFTFKKSSTNKLVTQILVLFLLFQQLLHLPTYDNGKIKLENLFTITPLKKNHHGVRIILTKLTNNPIPTLWAPEQNKDRSMLLLPSGSPVPCQCVVF